MVASFYPHGHDLARDDTSGSSGISGDVENWAAVITDLISQRASTNAHSERTGETSLHLAAR